MMRGECVSVKVGSRWGGKSEKGVGGTYGALYVGVLWWNSHLHSDLKSISGQHSTC